MNIEEIRKEIEIELNEMKTENKAWLNTKELSKFLKITISQIEMWRRENYGPSYLRLGKRKILYPKPAIIDFILSDQIKTS